MITVAKKRRPKSKNYFTKDTENAIVRYNNEPNPEIRSKIYRDEIHYAFFKLTENIIHTFKFYYTEVDQIEHLQHEIITFLLSKFNEEVLNKPKAKKLDVKTKTLGSMKSEGLKNMLNSL